MTPSTSSTAAAAAAAADAHLALVGEFEAVAAELAGYSLVDPSTYEAPPRRDAAWIEGYLGRGPLPASAHGSGEAPVLFL